VSRESTAVGGENTGERECQQQTKAEEARRQAPGGIQEATHYSGFMVGDGCDARCGVEDAVGSGANGCG
jgi:hypothetical protein